MLRPVIALVFAGCATAHVPAAFRGYEPVTIANEMADPLCSLAFTTDSSSTENWLGGTIIRPLEQQRFDIKPGRYRVEASTCSTHERASGFVDVRDFIVVAIGAWREPAPAYVRTGIVPAVAR